MTMFRCLAPPALQKMDDGCCWLVTRFESLRRVRVCQCFRIRGVSLFVYTSRHPLVLWLCYTWRALLIWATIISFHMLSILSFFSSCSSCCPLSQSFVSRRIHGPYSFITLRPIGTIGTFVFGVRSLTRLQSLTFPCTFLPFVNILLYSIPWSSPPLPILQPSAHLLVKLQMPRSN